MDKNCPQTDLNMSLTTEFFSFPSVMQ